jgi:amino acid efflux transporter
MGTMNVYMSGGAKLIAALAQAGSLPRRLAGDASRSVPRIPLYAVSATAVPLFAGLIAGVGTTDELIRATSACFIAVYAFALASAARILAGRMRVAAVFSLALVCVLVVFSSWYLLVPVAAALAALALHRVLLRELRRARDAASDALG